ncbi:hypothetical protein L3073_01505 [Ancylomarina sp. DW003]|nr:hypothetical protein [Ancylomarina sp. DW003]MDE5420877.1 hypothetical protein [Ancylomarina sp. DW003]
MKKKLNNELDVFNEIFIKGQDYKDVRSKKHVWEELAHIFNGELKIKYTVSKVLYTLNLEIPYKNHNVVLIETDTKPLKFNVELDLNRSFEFNLSWEDYTEKVMKIFGKQDIDVGDERFDEKYLIQSNETELLKRFFKGRKLKESILKNNIYIVSFELLKNKGISNLLTVKDRNTKDINTLIELVQLQFMLIDRFIELGFVRNGGK